MSHRNFEKYFARPLTRRRFLKHSVYTAAGVFVGTHGLSFAQGSQGGTITWMGHQEVAGLGPNDIGPDVHAAVIFNILNPLIHVNHVTDTEMVLAKSVTLSEDQLSYTFELNEGVMFHDGSEFTAEDVKYTYETYSQPGNTVASRFTGMRDVEVAGKYTAIVHMDSINAAFLRQAGEVPIVPKAYHESVGVDGFRTAPIGTGAFSLESWSPASATVLTAFADHFRGAPYVDTLRLDVVPEPSVRTIALLTGEADGTVWPVSIEDNLDFMQNPDFRVVATNWNSPRHIPLNTRLPQLSDKRVRQAMMFALDRQRIVDDLEAGFGTVATSHLAPHNPYYNPNVKQYPYDPEQARALLDEAGWTVGSDGIRVKDGMRLSFTITTISGDQTRRPMAELAQIFLRDVGVEMLLAEAPVASILQGLREGTIEASLFNWTMGSTTDPNPAGTLSSNGGDNFTGFASDEMDALIAEGLSVVDPAARAPVYARTQELYAEEVPALLLHYNQGVLVFSNEMKGLPETVTSSTPLFFRGNEYSKG